MRSIIQFSFLGILLCSIALLAIGSKNKEFWTLYKHYANQDMQKISAFLNSHIKTPVFARRPSGYELRKD